MAARDVDYATQKLLVVAERRGRAAVELVSQPFRDGERLDIFIDDSPDGLACLAAVRWAVLCRLPVRVVLDDRVTDREPWSILAGNIHALDVPVAREKVRRCGIRRRDARSQEEDGTVPIPDDDAVWRIASDRSPVAGVWELPDNSALVSSRESREIDRRAIEDESLPGIVLMENAAVGAVRVAVDMLSAPGEARVGAAAPAPGNGVLIVVGGGNNGGDGLAVARGLRHSGVGADVLLLKDEDALRGDAATNLRFLRDDDASATIHSFRSSLDMDALLAGRALVIDAILGTGFHGSLSPEYQAVIQAINRCGAPVLALDIPSGLDSDSDTAPDGAIRARRTVTFAAVKRGLVTASGPEYTGAVYVAGIGTPVRGLASRGTFKE